MNSIFTWLLENNHWLFSGLGIFVIGSILSVIGYFIKKFRRIRIEEKDKAKLFRAENKSYLYYNVMVVNEGNEIIIVRDIEAFMGGEMGTIVHGKKSSVLLLATHSGKFANYFLSLTERLLPLSLAGNTSVDTKLLFEFTNADIAIEKLVIRFNTSKGKIDKPWKNDIVT